MFKLPKELPLFQKTHEIDRSLSFFERKLCEGIVRHCAKLCEMESVGESDPTDIAYNNALRDAKFSILREFGLEKK